MNDTVFISKLFLTSSLPFNFFSNPLLFQILRKGAEISLIFTQDEKEQYDSLFLRLIQFSHRKYFDYYSRNLSDLVRVMHWVVTKSPMEVSVIRDMKRLDEQSLMNFSFGMDEMSSLSAFDRMKLISANFQAFFGLWWTVFPSDLDIQVSRECLLPVRV